MKPKHIDYKNPFKRDWTDEQVQRAGEMFANGKRDTEVAAEVGKTNTAVHLCKYKLRKAGYTFPDLREGSYTSWTKEDEDLIIELHNQGVPSEDIAPRVGHSMAAVDVRLNQLRAKGRDVIYFPKVSHKFVKFGTLNNPTPGV